MKNIIGALIILLISKNVFSSCFIEEIVDLHDSGYSASEIREECSRKVDESDCSIGKIIRYAKDGKRLSYILRQCEIRGNYSNDAQRRGQYQTPSHNIATFCATPYGSCPMAVPIPQGSSCYCPGPYGAIWGIGR